MLTKCFAEIYNTELRATTAALCSTHLPLFTSWKCNEMKLRSTVRFKYYRFHGALVFIVIMFPFWPYLNNKCV